MRWWLRLRLSLSPFGDKPSEEAAPEPAVTPAPPASPVLCRQSPSRLPSWSADCKKAKKPAGKRQDDEDESIIRVYAPLFTASGLDAIMRCAGAATLPTVEEEERDRSFSPMLARQSTRQARPAGCQQI